MINRYRQAARAAHELALGELAALEAIPEFRLPRDCPESSAPEGIRTPDQWIRNPPLYPAELRAPVVNAPEVPTEAQVLQGVGQRPLFSGALVVGADVFFARRMPRGQRRRRMRSGGRQSSKSARGAGVRKLCSCRSWASVPIAPRAVGNVGLTSRVACVPSCHASSSRHA